jgi:butyrate kinase
MSGRIPSNDERSELSVFTSRRTPVVDLTAAGDGWAPAATAPAGDLPLGDVLDRLLDGLATAG